MHLSNSLWINMTFIDADKLTSPTLCLSLWRYKAFSMIMSFLTYTLICIPLPSIPMDFIVDTSQLFLQFMFNDIRTLSKTYCRLYTCLYTTILFFISFCNKTVGGTVKRKVKSSPMSINNLLNHFFKLFYLG